MSPDEAKACSPSRGRELMDAVSIQYVPEILMHLDKNPEVSRTSMAKTLGMTKNICLERLQWLERIGFVVPSGTNGGSSRIKYRLT